ncbi:MAG TPA: hypothetical protein VIX37_18855 [Candidatus Sulfotelmatobacter sp.]
METTVSIRCQQFGRHAPQSSEVGQIFPDREPAVNPHVIEQSSDTQLPVERVLRGRVVNHNRSRLRFQYSADHAQGGGLARAICAQQASDRSIRSLE